MNRKGLTLMETLLTTVLLGILFSSLFKLNSIRQETIAAMRANTTALYALESARNYVLLMNENANLPVKEIEPPGRFANPNLYLNMVSQDDVVRITFSDYRLLNGRRYVAEVDLKK